MPIADDRRIEERLSTCLTQKYTPPSVFVGPRSDVDVLMLNECYQLVTYMGNSLDDVIS